MRPIRILVIDDDPDEYTLVKDSLDAANVLNHVEYRSNGAEAVKHLRARADQKQPLPDIILLDMLMPEMRGRDVLARIKGDLRLRHIDVIALTNFVSDDFVQKVYEEGVCSYIRKPFTVESFLMALRNLPDKRYGLAIVSKDAPHAQTPARRGNKHVAAK